MTELVYRKQIRPVVEDGAVAVDRLFPPTTRSAPRSEHDGGHDKLPGDGHEAAR